MSSPWSEDYYTPVAEMDTNHILKSTLTGESRQQKGDSRTCLLCGFSYFFRPIRARISRKGKPFARHQTIAQDLIAEKKID